MVIHKEIHIVSFSIPYPPNFGGIIDVFYKIKYLKEAGVEVYLHCYQSYRDHQIELEKYCKKVYYYKRPFKLRFLFSSLPYNVLTRDDFGLIRNIKSNPAPVLMEGLACAAALDNPILLKMRKIVRTHHVEHDYYQGISKQERNWLKSYFFVKEARKLKRFEKVLQEADLIAGISPSDHNHFSEHYKKSIYLPAFHENESVTSLTGSGDYVLFHANLATPENVHSLKLILKEIIPAEDIPLVVAGKTPRPAIEQMIKKRKNTVFYANPDDKNMKELIQNAHVCLVPAFESTGLKVKLINSLYQGRHCLSNSFAVQKTGLEELCIVEDEPIEMYQHLKKLMKIPFTTQDLEKRTEVLDRHFNNQRNVSKLIDAIAFNKA